MNMPKILVLSVDCWNSTSGSDTFTNLLSGYDPEQIANIYFKSGVPDSKVCNKYFYISENSVIKSVFHKGLKTGMTVERIQPKATYTAKTNLAEDTAIEKKRYSFFSRYRLWIFLYAREFLWKLGKWRTDELDSFIDSFAPDVIFFPIESYIYFDRIAEYVLKKTKASAVGIMWDDNFTYKAHPYNIGFRCYRFFLRKRVERLIQNCKQVFAISPKMREELKREYGVKAKLLTKGVNLSDIDTTRRTDQINSPITISYTGKLNLGRLSSIQLLANVLDEINVDDIRYELNIYSGTELSSKELASLKKRGVHFKGVVTQTEVATIQAHSDVLLFAEALEGKHRYDARLSFSTKLVDYMASGKCILAIGPTDIAPIEYLKANDIALVCNNYEQLQDIFKYQLTKELILQYGKRATEFAMERHSIADIQKTLYSCFDNVVEDK